MARVYKQRDKWCFVIELGTENGKRKRIVRGGFLKEREAKKAAREFENDLEAGKAILKPSNISLHEFMWNVWFVYHKRFLKISSQIITQNTMRRIDRYFKKTKLNDITLTKCNDFINYLAYERKLSRQTMATTLACLKMVFKHAVIVEKILKNNPTEYVFLPKLYTNDRARIISLEDKKRLYLEKEEIVKFLSEARSARNAFPFATFFMLLIYTGMRAGEALALQWDNIDFSKKLIYIRSTVYYRTNNRFDVYSPKTKSSVRDVVISDTLINELKSYRQKFLTYKMRHRNIWNDHGYDFVFVSKTEPGNPIRYSTVSSCTRRLGNKIGFKNLHPHLFRHTHVSILAAERIPLSAIRERLGHTDDKTTEQIYLHITKQFKSEIALKFDKAIQNI